MADPGSNTRTSVSIRCACVSNCPRIAGRPTWTGSTSGCASARPGRTRFIPRRCWPRPHPGRHRYLPARPRAGAAYAVRARPDHRRRPRARASVAPPRRGVRIGRPGHILTFCQFPPRPLCPFRRALEKPLPCNALTASRLKWTRWEPTSHLAPAPTRPTAPRRSATPAYFSNDSWMLAVARFLQVHASRCALGVSFRLFSRPHLHRTLRGCPPLSPAVSKPCAVTTPNPRLSRRWSPPTTPRAGLCGICAIRRCHGGLCSCHVLPGHVFDEKRDPTSG